MRVLVTGHLGYIGTVLTPLLVQAGHQVSGIDSDLFARCTWPQDGDLPDIPFQCKDIRDVVPADFEEKDAVIHLAALSNDPMGDLRPDVTHDINTNGTLLVARAAKTAGVRRFIFSSSCSNYGAGGRDLIDEAGAFNPVTPYGISKVEAEKRLQELADVSFSPVYLRSATAYGVSPRLRFDLVLNNLVAWAVTTGEIRMKSDGSPWRPIVHVEDIARAMLAALEAPAELVHNQAFNVGITDHNYRIREIAEIVSQAVPNCRVSFAPGARPDKRTYKVDCSKIAGLPGFHPKWDPLTGARSLYESCRDRLKGTEDFEGPRYQRIGHLKQLLSDNRIGTNFRPVDAIDANTRRADGRRADQGISDFADDAQDASCVSCGHTGLTPVLDLGPMPLSNGLMADHDLEHQETVMPLRVVYCSECGLVQLIETPPAKQIFGSDYPYFSSYSDILLDHSSRNADELIENRKLGAGNLVIEIASNDGYLLKAFQKHGIPVLGIDPAPGPAEAARALGIETIVDFFGTDLADKLASQGKRADILIANNVVPHVADPNDLVAGMAGLLSDDGLALVEFAYVRDLLKKRSFDTIYHEHRCYFSLHSAQALFRRHGLYVNDVRRLPIHGGSLRLYLSKSPAQSLAVRELLDDERDWGVTAPDTYLGFADRVQEFKRKARDLISELRANGARLAAYGAAAKGTIMLNYLALDTGEIEFAVDKNPYKQGKYIPGPRIPICDPSRLVADRPDYALLLVWNIADEIVSQQQDYLKAGGRFIVMNEGLDIIGSSGN